MGRLFLLVQMLVFGSSLHSQESWGETTHFRMDSVAAGWVREFGSDEFPMIHFMTDVEVDAQGNLYVMGSRYSDETAEDYMLLKYAPDGTELWEQTYNGTANAMDLANDIVLDDDGNIYVTGSSSGVGTSSDFVTIKYWPDGTQIWTARYSASATLGEEANVVDLDDLGNVYVAGGSAYDYALVKYSPEGEQLWAARYNGPDNGWDTATDMRVSNDGFAYVTGISSGGSTQRDIATLKYNPNGNLVWARRYNGTGNTGDEAYALTIDRDDNVYVTGAIEVADNDRNIVTLKYYPTGARAWVAIYDGPAGSFDLGHDIAVDRQGNTIVTGLSFDTAIYNSFVTIKYDSQGSREWITRHASGGEGRSVVVDVHGDIYSTGSHLTQDMMSASIATVKYGSDGTQQWLMEYASPGEDCWDEPWGIALDDFGNVYVAGIAEDMLEAQTKGLAIKYTQPDYVVSVNSRATPEDFQLFHNFPNPFNPSTQIRYELQEAGDVTLKIYNVTGREIQTLVSDYQAPGAYRVTWSGEDKFGQLVSTGMYFAQLRASETSGIIKMTYLK